MGKRNEAMGILEDASLIRLSVDEWLGESLVRLLAAPFQGGQAQMNLLALDQWGDELELYLVVRKTVGLSTVMGTEGKRWGFKKEKGPFWDRVASALETRWPPREGSVFVAGRIRPETETKALLVQPDEEAPVTARRLDDVDPAKQLMKDLYSDALQGRQARNVDNAAH